MTKTTTDRIDTELVDQLLRNYQKPEDVLGENGLLKQFTKALLERAMQVELSEHLGYEKHSAAGDNSGNSRNGTSEKTLKGDFGTLPIEVPRDRNASFEPKIVPKGQTRLSSFNEKILSLYARGLTTREIQQHIAEIYKVEVEAFADLERHRSGDGGCCRVADETLRSHLPHTLYGRFAGQSQRWRACHQ